MVIKFSENESITCNWYICPKCKEDMINSDHSYCPNCGRKLTKKDKKQINEFEDLKQEINESRDVYIEEDDLTSLDNSTVSSETTYESDMPKWYV
jgi:PHP family Zn ribbon phosphoesterase